MREARCVGGLIGGLWFACHLYEIGFLARFGVPGILAEVGFSRVLAAGLTAAPAGALAAALLVAALGCRGRCAILPVTAFTALTGILVLALTMAAGLVDDPALVALGGRIDLGVHPVALVLYLCLILYAGLLFLRFRELLRQGAPRGVILASLLILLLMLLPVGLGWLGGGAKMENRRSFLYLADRPDYVLIRLYWDKAVFVRYDRTARRFGQDWLVHRLDDPEQAYVTLRPPGA